MIQFDHRFHRADDRHRNTDKNNQITTEYTDHTEKNRRLWYFPLSVYSVYSVVSFLRSVGFASHSCYGADHRLGAHLWLKN